MPEDGNFWNLKLPKDGSLWVHKLPVLGDLGLYLIFCLLFMIPLKPNMEFMNFTHNGSKIVEAIF